MSSQKVTKLSELEATAICGNDITSSVLYVSALTIVTSGKYAWVSLLIVAAILFLFRKIYGEVVGALPLNGGAYNALVNTTRKSTASVAASLTILSYIATSVISASEAMAYLHTVVPWLPVISATILLLSIFMGLTILGIGESAFVAVIIFIFHLACLTVLAGTVIIHLYHRGLGTLWINWRTPTPHKKPIEDLYWGFSAAMLGISGFESSASFVEQQKRGVFPKTLRNMWIAVSIFNPLMAFLALTLIPIYSVHNHMSDLLSYMGKIAGGNWLATLISVDAAVVLSGAVLTSYVGVSGLVERITLDRIFPAFFLKKNRRGSCYRIIIAFFLLCLSILFITKGEVDILAGVYTIAFLSVMTLFATGNILLKLKRKSLPRPERASWPGVFIALFSVIAALIGNIVKTPQPGQPANVVVFGEYFIPTIMLITIMLNRIALLEILLNFIEFLFVPILEFVTNINQKIYRTIDKIQSQEFVFFTRGDNISNLNKVILYIRRNEHTKKIKIVTAMDHENKALLEKLKKDLEFLKRVYPDVKIDFVVVREKFTPELVRKLAKKWGIPINFMFIGSPGDRFPYRIEELGGVRLII